MMNTDTQAQPPQKVSCKYRLAELIKKQQTGMFRDNCYLICIHLGISTKTLENWMKIKKDERSSIPSDSLFGLAEYFSVNPSDLLNK